MTRAILLLGFGLLGCSDKDAAATDSGVGGGDAAQALGNSLDLARHAEQWGYTRYWVAEHHNMPGVASAATSVVSPGTGRRCITLALCDGPKTSSRLHGSGCAGRTRNQ